jgi:hypothetical protein
MSKLPCLKSVVGDPAQLMVDVFRPKVALLCAMNVFVSGRSTMIWTKEEQALNL